MIDLSFPHHAAFPSLPAAWRLRVVSLGMGLLLGGATTGQATAEPPPVRQAASQTAQVAHWIDELRSDSFAAREAASEKLFRLGHVALDRLRETRKSSQDAEQVERLSQLIATLAEQDLELRIERFLRGGNSELENWEEVEKWFGDSPRVRELFVDLYREHPYLVECLDGNAQELALGLSRVSDHVMDRDATQLAPPRRIDLIAMLLVMTKPGFHADTQHDLIVASLLQLHSAYEFRSDPVFGEAFGRMVSNWMSESHLAIRGQVLRQALDWDMDVALPLALKTLDQNPDAELLCRCMQAITSKGEKKHALRLQKYLDDTTVVYRPQYLGEHGGDVQVGDVAAAAIAHLFDVPVTEIGFAKPAEHDVMGIFFEELAIPSKTPGDKSVDGEETDEEESDDESDGNLAPFDDLKNPPMPDQQNWQRFQQIRKASLHREAARKQIHAKARKLLSKLPPERSEKS